MILNPCATLIVVSMILHHCGCASIPFGGETQQQQIDRLRSENDSLRQKVQETVRDVRATWEDQVIKFEMEKQNLKFQNEKLLEILDKMSQGNVRLMKGVVVESQHDFIRNLIQENAQLRQTVTKHEQTMAKMQNQRCDLCDINFDSQSLLDAHRASFQHRNEEEQKRQRQLRDWKCLPDTMPILATSAEILVLKETIRTLRQQQSEKKLSVSNLKVENRKLQEKLGELMREQIIPASGQKLVDESREWSKSISGIQIDLLKERDLKNTWKRKHDECVQKWDEHVNKLNEQIAQMTTKMRRAGLDSPAPEAETVHQRVVSDVISCPPSLIDGRLQERYVDREDFGRAEHDGSEDEDSTSSDVEVVQRTVKPSEH